MHRAELQMLVLTACVVMCLVVMATVLSAG